MADLSAEDIKKLKELNLSKAQVDWLRAQQEASSKAATPKSEDKPPDVQQRTKEVINDLTKPRVFQSQNESMSQEARDAHWKKYFGDKPPTSSVSDPFAGAGSTPDARRAYYMNIARASRGEALVDPTSVTESAMQARQLAADKAQGASDVARIASAYKTPPPYVAPPQPDQAIGAKTVSSKELADMGWSDKTVPGIPSSTPSKTQVATPYKAPPTPDQAIGAATVSPEELAKMGWNESVVPGVGNAPSAAQTEEDLRGNILRARVTPSLPSPTQVEADRHLADTRLRRAALPEEAPIVPPIQPSVVTPPSPIAISPTASVRMAGGGVERDAFGNATPQWKADFNSTISRQIGAVTGFPAAAWRGATRPVARWASGLFNSGQQAQRVASWLQQYADPRLSPPMTDTRRRRYLANQ